VVPELCVIGDVEGNGPEQSDGRPCNRREEKGLAQGQAAGQATAGHMGQCGGTSKGDATADEKGAPVRIARECVDTGRQEHSRRKRKEHPPRQVEDRADVGRSPCA
jgi:hypothetical protein